MSRRFQKEIHQALAAAVGKRLEGFGKKLFEETTAWRPDQLPSPEELKDLSPTLYIHIPFCHLPLCEMCPFCRQGYRQQEAQQYMRDVRQDLEKYRGVNFPSTYIGGGTPVTVIDDLVDIIQDFGLNGQELSVEAHPADLTPENLDKLEAAKVTRLSVGVQSFHEKFLQQMGRNNGKNPLENLRRAHKRFVVNADLIYNFEGQTIADFLKDVDQLIAEGMTQITCYPLMPAPGKFVEVDASKEKEFYEAMQQRFAEAGYIPLTPWCFATQDRASQGEYISSTGGDSYVGVGISAISKLDSLFTINTFDSAQYHQQVTAGEPTVIGSRTLSKAEAAQYFLLTNLFGMRMNLDALTGDPQKDFLIRTEVHGLQAMGLLQIRGQVAELTPQGMYFFSTLMKDFYTGLNFFRDAYKNPQTR